MKTWKKIGEILVEKKLIGNLNLSDALEQQQKEKGVRKLGEILLDNGFIDEVRLYEELAQQWELEFVPHIDLADVDTVLLEQFPLEHLRRIQTIPVHQSEEKIFVLSADPFRPGVIEELNRHFKKTVNIVVMPPLQIQHVLNETYGRGRDSSELIETISVEDGLEGDLDQFEIEDVLESANKAPVVKFVNTLIFQSLRERASDIHLELSPDSFKIRYRIDGVLVNRFSPPRRLHAPVTSRIKIMAGLDIAERRLPQDGKIRVRFGDREVDIRVSSVPCAHGERVVMRLLDRKTELLTLEQMGMQSDILIQFDRLIRRPNGILLVTGPTGSGKTTTLYGAIMRIVSPDVNVITLEDPVEYELEGASQIPVKPKIGFTFASGLRSILRQDPDVILVGEIRDDETAAMAIQASLTGHLVFSTLHTNDSASAAVRLMDMNVEPYLVASTLIGVLAQRLVRRLCSACARRDESGAWHSDGCAACSETGFKGRTGVYELLDVNEEIASLIGKSASLDEIRAASRRAGMRTLFEDGIEKVKLGQTSLAEVERVCWQGN
ncbi:MAG: ral secretion pathway protein [Clostridiales bacterium]|jgi:general secretion pathway protein E|nr:ral secretion pathway protein [Clostridiales bacterium]MDN5283667.1 ral secretion pathway protein [Candidatus Ozemobacter sp.]